MLKIPGFVFTRLVEEIIKKNGKRNSWLSIFSGVPKYLLYFFHNFILFIEKKRDEVEKSLKNSQILQ